MQTQLFLLAFSKMNPQVSIFGVIVKLALVRQPQATIPDSIHCNGVCASSPTDIANTFSQFFAECFNHADASNTPIPQYNFSSTLSCFSCSSSDVLYLVHKLANNSAAGIDGISSRLLKNTATSILSHPLQTFQSVAHHRQSSLCLEGLPCYPHL